MKRMRGFTLIELIAVIAVTGILAAVLTVFLKPAIDSYLDTRRRGTLTDMADTALRRIAQDVRSAVPNSIRTAGAGTDCFQLVPTINGGRYRMARDTTQIAANSRWVDTTVATTGFDVFNVMNSTLKNTPAANDWVVINNQNTNDVYDGINRGRITSVQTPPGTGGLSVGQHRILINATQFPVGYNDGRFVVVRDTEQTVTYSCSGSVLYRTPANFGPAQCGVTASSAIVATNVSFCQFRYDPSQGATQQSGFIAMKLTLTDTDSGESVSLVHGVHVENVP